jgi:multiple sugar transport system substrate-binding protein
MGLYATEKLPQQAPHLRLLQQALHIAQPSPRLSYYPQVSAIIQRWINGVLAGRYEAAYALQATEQEIQTLLARYDQ